MSGKFSHNESSLSSPRMSRPASQKLPAHEQMISSWSKGEEADENGMVMRRGHAAVYPVSAILALRRFPITLSAGPRPG